MATRVENRQGGADMTAEVQVRTAESDLSQAGGSREPKGPIAPDRQDGYQGKFASRHQNSRLLSSDGDRSRWLGGLFGRPLTSYRQDSNVIGFLAGDLRLLQSEIAEKLKRKADLTEEATSLVNENLSLLTHEFYDDAELRGRVSEIHREIAALDEEVAALIAKRDERHVKADHEKASDGFKDVLALHRGIQSKSQLSDVFGTYREIEATYFEDGDGFSYPVDDWYGIAENDLPDEVRWPLEGLTPILARGDGKELFHWVFVRRGENGRLIVCRQLNERFVDIGDESAIESGVVAASMDDIARGAGYYQPATYTPEEQARAVAVSAVSQAVVDRALKDHPALGEMSRIGADLAGLVEPLRIAIAGGIEGYTKDAGYLELIQSQARSLQDYYYDNRARIDALYVQLIAMRRELEKSGMAGRQTEFARNVESLIGQVDAVVEAIDGVPELCDGILELNADRDERMIKHWLATDGLVMVTAIAGGVLVMTGVGAVAGSAMFGTIPSIALSASAMGVGGVAGQEVGSYLSGKIFDTGLKSGMQSFVSGEMTGEDLGEYYMRSWATQSSSSFGFMLAGKGFGKVAVWMASSSNSAVAETGEAVLRAGGAISGGFDRIKLVSGKTPFGRLVARLTNETGSEIIEEGAENAAGAVHPVLGTVATTLNSIDGRNVTVQPTTVTSAVPSHKPLPSWKEIETKGPAHYPPWQRMDTDMITDREAFVDRYSYAVPSPEAIRAIADFARGDMVLEIGAGKGLWAALLSEAGVRIIPTDNFSSYGSESISPGEIYADVERLSHSEAVAKYGDEAGGLMMVWPPSYFHEESVASEALKAFKGDRLVYVGERADDNGAGCTANEAFWQEIDENWEEVGKVDIPRWESLKDEVILYRRKGKDTVASSTTVGGSLPDVSTLDGQTINLSDADVLGQTAIGGLTYAEWSAMLDEFVRGPETQRLYGPYGIDNGAKFLTTTQAELDQRREQEDLRAVGNHAGNLMSLTGDLQVRARRRLESAGRGVSDDLSQSAVIFLTIRELRGRVEGGIPISPEKVAESKASLKSWFGIDVDFSW